MEPLELLDGLLRRARAAGADAADALLAEGTSLQVRRRLGEIERLERAEGRDLGLRVFVGRSQAIVSTSDLGRDVLERLVDQAVASARNLPEDPHAGLAEPDQISRSQAYLDLDDGMEPTAEALIERAATAEEAALAMPDVSNSEGAEASWSRSRVTLAASNGFAGSYARSLHAIGVSAIAGSGTGMERDYDEASAVHLADLPDPAGIGRSAGLRAARRLGPRKMATARLPVVFDPRVAGSIVRHLVAAISGPAVARGTTFLRDRMGEAVFAQGITIQDDPLRQRGLRSRPFDAEGIAPSPRALVEDGVLGSWLLDLASARQLGLRTTGHAARGVSGPPSPAPSNAWIAPGPVTPEEMLEAIPEGLYVTEMIGSGISYVTGDYSRGAAGFWIQRGELGHPVSEVTIAGNLADMFKSITVASDLVFRYGIDAPTLRIDGLTVAGR